MNTLEAPNNWHELDDLLWSRSFDTKWEKYRPYIAFRGLPKDYGNLRTSIQRLGDPEPQLDATLLLKRERRLIDSFRMYASEHLSIGPSDWDVILLAQQYRLPTRLLDWTSSPYVALFFATEDSSKDNEDGIVWCVSRLETNTSLPIPLKDILKNQGGGLFTIETLNKQSKQLEKFDKITREAFIWFEPPSLSPRIVNQYAFYSVMPGVDTSQSEWLEKHPSWHWCIPIPSRLKTEIRQRLQVMNITQRVMYPGLEGVAQWLKAYFSGA